MSLQFAGAVIESEEVGVAVEGDVGLAKGVRVAGSVAVTNAGVGFDGVGPAMETWHAVSRLATKATVKSDLLMVRF